MHCTRFPPRCRSAAHVTSFPPLLPAATGWSIKGIEAMSGQEVKHQERELGSRRLEPLGWTKMESLMYLQEEAQGAIPTVAIWQRNSMCK